MVRHANVVELMNDVSDRIKRRACRVAAPRQRQPVLVGRTDRRREDAVDIKVRHLVHHGLARTTPKGDPYLARHCRRNMVGSPSRGVPVVVDYR